MKLLLVEDDPTLAEGIAEFLRGQGDEVAVENDGMQADRLLQETSFDFVLLDLGLPGLGGYEVVRRIRKRGQRMPVILITARDALDDRIYGLDLGADDYLVKPFALQELHARIRALYKRSHRNSDKHHYPGYWYRQKIARHRHCARPTKNQHDERKNTQLGGQRRHHPIQNPLMIFQTTAFKC